MARDSGGAAGRVRGLGERAREALTSVADGLRRAGRHQRMRLAVVGGWTALSLLSLWIACSSPSSNSLGADVHVLKDSLVGGQQLLVRNESTSIWTDVVLTLDGEWRHEQRTMRPHDQIVLSPSSFRRGDEVAPRDYKPRTLTIESAEGRARFDLR